MRTGLPTPLPITALLLAATIVSTVLISGLEKGSDLNFYITATFVGIAGFACIVKRRPFKVHPEVLILLTWLFYALLQSLSAYSLDSAIDRGIQVFQIIVLMALALNVMAWSDHFRLYTWAYVGAAVLSYLLSVMDLGQSLVEALGIQQQMTGTRATGTAGNANQFGTMMVLAQFAAVYVGILAKSFIERTTAACAYLVLGIAAVNSGSRTALVGMIFLAFGLTWVFRIWKLRQATQAIVTLVGLSVLGVAVYTILGKNEQAVDAIESFTSDEQTVSRYKNLYMLVITGGDIDQTDDTKEQSLTDRSKLAKQAWQAGIDNAPFGLGLDNYAVTHGVYAHSNYLDILADTGFFGLLIFLGVYVCMLYRTMSSPLKRFYYHPFVRLYILSLFVLMIMDAFRVSYYNKQYWLYIVLAIGGLEFFRRNQLRQSQREYINEDSTSSYMATAQPTDHHDKFSQGTG